ncbi:hypothetical protein [Streptococcus sp. E17BB]|uniref:hypothetical protein n=1 Tax=Streptococcus sp. E17BB TaxID=3278714 RepID=UPI00359D4B7F
MKLIKKKEVEQFRIFILELNTFHENRFKMDYSSAISPELAGILGGVGTGALGVASIFSWLSGMSGAQMMSALASFGFGGAVGGIVSLVAAVATPVVLVSGGFYTVANQRKLKKELIQLSRVANKMKIELASDDRPKVKELLKTIDLMMVDFINHYGILKTS